MRRGQCGVLKSGIQRVGCLCASGTVDGVAGAGEVVAQLLRDELFDLDGLPGVVGAVVVVGVALGDELVAFREALVGAFGGLPERDEVVEGGLGLRERAIVFAAVVFLPDLHEQSRVTFLGERQVRFGSDEPGQGLLCVDSHWTLLVTATPPVGVLCHSGAPTGPSSPVGAGVPVCSSSSTTRR